MARAGIITVAKNAADAWRGTDTYHQAAQIIDMLVSELEEKTTLTPQNESLTIEQLLRMNSTPIWVVDTTINRSEWCYWKNGRVYSCEAPPEYYDPDDYGQWIAYRRPKEEQ